MSQTRSVEVVTDVNRCRDIVKELEKSEVIAVDAEGVQLGKDGPLTLLQVGTVDHDVFLFDIHTNKALFTEGKLQDLLTSPRITKVVHSCHGDSAALYFQFNIRLQNVFDTQVANQMIEESKGRELVPLLKLEDICQKYSSVAKVADQKDAVKDLWVREIGDLWARRPMSDDMVQYAAGDVTALVPEVYNNMDKYIKEHGLLLQFQKRTEEEVLFEVDEQAREQRQRRVKEATNRILKTIDKKYSSEADLKDIDDQNVIMAIQRLHVNELGAFSPLINRLKCQSMQQGLDNLEESFLSEDGTFNIVNGRFDRSLKTAYSSKDPLIKDRTRALQDRVVKITLDHIARKNDVTTPLSHISRHDKDALNWMRPSPSGENDSRYNKVVLALYWKLMEADLDETVQRFGQKPTKFTMHEGYYKKVKFYMHKNTSVPQSIKVKAIDFMKSLEGTYGEGVVPKHRVSR